MQSIWIRRNDKKKLSVLKEHCKSVGRDYDSILKTKLGLIVVDNDNERVEKRVQNISKIMPGRTSWRVFDVRHTRRGIETVRIIGRGSVYSTLL